MRQRWYNHSKFCVHCGDTFEASRFDAKFCSAKCRSANHRVQLKRSRLLQQIKDSMQEILDDCPTAEAYSVALDDIQDSIDRARFDTI